MKDADQISFTQTLTSVMRFYDKVLDEFTISAFWEILKTYDLYDIQNAFMRYISKKEFAPKPASIKLILDAPLREKAEWAWDIVHKALISNEEAYLNNDPLTDKVIYDMGGWNECVSNFRKHYICEEFKKRYGDYIYYKSDPSYQPLPYSRPGENVGKKNDSTPPPKEIIEMINALRKQMVIR